MTFKGTLKYSERVRSDKYPYIKIELKNNNKLRIYFIYDRGLIKKVKFISGRKWNPMKKYWEVPYSKDLIAKFQSLFGENLVVDPYFYLIPLEKDLSIGRYSRRTIKACMIYNRDLLIFAKKKPEEIDNEDIKKFLYFMVKEKKVSTSTLNIIINALKFYYGEILKKKFIYDVKRPKKDKKLPVVLSRGEVKRILDASQNLKHKAILTLAYSAGLRVGKVVKLKPEDIDSKRGLIYIKGSKGRKWCGFCNC